MARSLVTAAALGHGPADKRLEILQLVGRHGSISQAARSAGVSYKAAWQAIDTPGSVEFLPVALGALLAADVAVVQVPAAFGGYWLPYARAFYAAEALGVLPQSHDAMFNAIHVQRSLPVNNNVTAEQIAPFYAQYGVDAKRFADTFNSFGVDAKINRAKQFAVKTRIEGTPAIVVNGKYTVPVDQQGFGKMLNTVDCLVAKERGGAN